VNEAIIEAIASTPKVCQYIDMPLQHADDEVLRAMRRPMSGAAYLDLIRRFRGASPDVAIRTTFIVGFPGETEAQFANLEWLVEEAQFDRVGVFEYSVEEGTPSAELPSRVPARVKRSRMERLMKRQQAISRSRNERWVGQGMEVLVEETGNEVYTNGGLEANTTGEHGSRINKVTPNSALDATDVHAPRPVPFHTSATVAGRSFRDAPEIDGQVLVRIENEMAIRPGQFITARIVEAREYDLVGVME